MLSYHHREMVESQSAFFSFDLGKEFEMKYAVLYQWYETTRLGVIEAESEYMAKVRFCIKELKEAKVACVSSDLFLDTEEGSLRQQIQDLVTGYGTGTMTCFSCDREWLF